MKELTGLQKEKIEYAINEEMDNLEDNINDMLKGILIGIGLEDNQEALVFAREIFFKG
jgi:hypothetical protein